MTNQPASNCPHCLVPVAVPYTLCRNCDEGQRLDEKDRYLAHLDEVDRHGYPEPDEDPHSSGLDDEDEDDEESEEDE